MGGYPIYWFDGMVDAVGAYSTINQQYNWYLGIINGRLAVPTYVTVDLDFVLRDADNYEIDVTATVGVEEGGEAEDLKVHVVQVIDHYPTVAEQYRNCVMEAGGSNLPTINPGESVEFTKTFILTGASITNLDNVEFVVFVREQGASGPAEIHNSTWTGGPGSLPWPYYVDGDVDRDGDVDIGDLAGLLGAYGTVEGEEDYEPHADFDPNQWINLGDLAALLGNYGYTP